MTKPKRARMRDGLIQRGEGRWTAVFTLGYSDPDPITGKRKLLQKSKSLGRCTLAEAKARRDELAVSIRRGEFVQPSKQTLAQWSNVWLDESVRPARRGNTVLSYQSLIANHIIPALGGVQLQALRPGHLSKYYAEKTRAGLSSGTLGVHHAVLSSALSSAVKQGLVTRNVAALVDGKPKARTDREQAKLHCWSAEEARSFLRAAADAGPQLAALFSLALDSGARRGELLGLRWADVDLDAGTLLIDRQLLSRNGADPVFGPTKHGRARTIDLSQTTILRLRQHRAAQAETKMANRLVYVDYQLVFARTWDDINNHSQRLGQPLSETTFATAMERIIKTAGVKRIKPHGLRHTSATLLLGAGEPVHVVAERLGHRNAVTLLGFYAHALPAHGRAAAATLGRLLHGNG